MQNTHNSTQYSGLDGQMAHALSTGSDSVGTHFQHGIGTRKLPFDSSDFRELFSMFDKDGSGGIDEPEFRLMMKQLGLPNIPFPVSSQTETVSEKNMLTSLSAARPGKVEDSSEPDVLRYEDLCALLAELTTLKTERQVLEQSFLFFSRGDSVISARGLMAAYNELGDTSLTIADAEILVEQKQGYSEGVTLEEFMQVVGEEKGTTRTRMDGGFEA